MTGGTTAIVPVKTLATAKSRLAGTLTARQRADLVVACFDRVLRAIQDSGAVDRCIVVTAEPAICDRALGAGAEAVDEDGSSLDSGPDRHNHALEAARRVALDRTPKSLLVVSADLPWLRSDEVRGLVTMGQTAAGIVIAPDRDGRGTNALLLHPPDAIRFQFGEDSCARHRRAAVAARFAVQVFDAPGTAFDVDRPEDLMVWNRGPEASRWGAVV